MVVEEIGEPQRNHRIVLLSVADGSFGIAIEAVKEIVPITMLSRPPAMPSILEGFFNLGGSAVPVLRLDILLGFSRQPLEPYSSFVVLRNVERPVALLVQRVTGIASALSGEFRPLKDHSFFNGCIESDLSLDTSVAHILSVDRLLLEKERRAIAEFQLLETSRLHDLART